MEDLQVSNNPSNGRFEITLGDETAFLSYQNRPGRIIYIHAQVPPAYRHLGIAGLLTSTALDYARSEGLKVVPRCPYVANYIRLHPEYQDLEAT
ncbi:MAG: N-acetyltransferase [Gammaproteobacteria bacterium]|nr:N-acetyltransferase [Gammaproteobacteria bacterium]